MIGMAGGAPPVQVPQEVSTAAAYFLPEPLHPACPPVPPPLAGWDALEDRFGLKLHEPSDSELAAPVLRPDIALDDTFVESDKYIGSQAGWYYGTGPRGLGYYPLPAAAVVDDAQVSLSPPCPSPSSQGTIISLSLSLEPSYAIDYRSARGNEPPLPEPSAPASRRARKKRRKPRKCFPPSHHPS